MNKFRIRKGDGIDAYLKYHFIPKLKDHIVNEDDDALFLAVGETSTGKSTLFLHFLDEYLGDQTSVDLVGFDTKGIADAIAKATKMDGLRAWLNDEGNLNKRNAMTKFNKDVIDLYFSIRGLNILNLWANPSLDMIDRPFIEEKILDGIFLCTQKKGSPRPYFYFNQRALMRIYKRYKNLKLNTLNKVRRTEAEYMGRYKEYNGILKGAYSSKKKDRMKNKISSFKDKYGSNQWVRTSKVGKRVGYTKRTVRKYLRKLKESGEVEKGKDYKIEGNTYLIHENTIKKIQEKMREVHSDLVID